jgi:lipid-binding SYLF domain-containing protein
MRSSRRSAKGGLLVGGAYGRGEVYMSGQMIGWADVTQETIGLQAGGQTFSELIVFEDRPALDRFRMQPGNFLANATAT